MRLKILTYNIHKGIGGVDRKYRLNRVVDVIRHYQPDVALLQEVDDGVPRSHKDRQAEAIAEHLEFRHVLFQPNVTLRQGTYGNAILSRLPIHDPLDVELTIPLKKRRRALVGRLTLEHQGHHRTLVIVNLHLGLAGLERRIQLNRLLRDPAIERLHRDTPCVVGGDFNDLWGAIARRVMRPAGFHSATGHQRTFPASIPLRPLDAIYYRGDCTPVHAHAGRVQLAHEASDHLPLVAEFDVGCGE